MRRLKHDRNKPIPIDDLQAIAKFRAELGVMAKLEAGGLSHVEAMRKVFGNDPENQ
jgi:hypothetical protein